MLRLVKLSARPKGDLIYHKGTTPDTLNIIVCGKARFFTPKSPAELKRDESKIAELMTQIMEKNIYNHKPSKSDIESLSETFEIRVMRSLRDNHKLEHPLYNLMQNLSDFESVCKVEDFRILGVGRLSQYLSNNLILYK